MRSLSIALLAAGLIGIAMAGETIRCGTHLITEGDPVTNLLEHCGEPTTRIGNQWIYDFGEDQLVTVVTLRGNDLDIDRIEQIPGD